MSDVYSISVNGIHNGERALERSASRIAAGRADASDSPPLQREDAVSISTDGAAALAASGTVDYAAEMVAILQARTAIKANLKMIEVAASVDQDAVDLLG